MGQRNLTKNTLFYGDNLDIMRQYLADESVDLIYLDPPFNSNRNYNVLYKDESGLESSAQIMAFEDTWHWSLEVTEPEFDALKARGDALAEMVTALVKVMKRNSMTAYLVMMANRLTEMHRILKPTGSLYLHCDPTASHYLKMILDMIFGGGNFRGEVIWKRSGAHNLSKTWDAVHDVLLFYSRSEKYIWNQVYEPYSEEYLRRFKRTDADGRLWQDVALTAGGTKESPQARSQQSWRGHNPPPGRNWSAPRLITDHLGLPRDMDVIEKLEAMDKAGYIYWSPSGGLPRFKQYLDLLPGSPVTDLWSNISPINSQAVERLGYPTQKPLALLERIIQASSNPGDVVLDPFCGCGTAVHAAQKLGRIWIGIDITRIATTLIKSRLYDAFKIEAKKDYDLIGEPTTLDEARHLATKDDRYQFQWWALGLLPARPYGGQGDSKVGKKGADKGIDGVMTFQDRFDGPHHRIIIQVKSGKVQRQDISVLNSTVDREKAVIGVFVTLEPPTRNMELEALEMGKWHSESWHRDYPKIQILTIEQLLQGAKVQFPGMKNTTLTQAGRDGAGLEQTQRPLL